MRPFQASPKAPKFESSKVQGRTLEFGTFERRDFWSFAPCSGRPQSFQSSKFPSPGSKFGFWKFQIVELCAIFRQGQGSKVPKLESSRSEFGTFKLWNFRPRRKGALGWGPKLQSSKVRKFKVGLWILKLSNFGTFDLGGGPGAGPKAPTFESSRSDFGFWNL